MVESNERVLEADLLLCSKSCHPLQYWDLCRLDRFPPRLLDRLEILHLLVHHSNVSEIHLDAFRGVEEKLESLDLSQNALEEVSRPSPLVSALFRSS